MDQAYLNNLKGFFKQIFLKIIEFFFSNEGPDPSKSHRSGAISWLRYDEDFFFQQIWLLLDPEHVIQVFENPELHRNKSSSDFRRPPWALLSAQPTSHQLAPNTPLRQNILATRNTNQHFLLKLK